MSIATAIQNAQQRVADCYTAISNKGGTLPATQNLANMPTAIWSIPSGSTGYTEFPSYQVVNGVASKRSGALTGNEFSDITSVGDYGLYYAYASCKEITGQLDLSSITSIGVYGAAETFWNCIGITGTVDLSGLIEVGQNGLNYFCSGCNGITSVNLSSLSSLGNGACIGAFQSCTRIQSIYFNSLTTTSFGSSTNQFNNMLSSAAIISGTCTVHFPSNLQSTISGLLGYPTFGGTASRIVLAFDLPATS